MTTPQPAPAQAPAAPSPYFLSITGTDKLGNVTTVFPGALREYATLATANAVIAALNLQTPESGPFSLVDENADSSVAWSQPMYGIVANNAQVFNAGLIFALLSQGGYNAMLAVRQVRQSVVGY